MPTPQQALTFRLGMAERYEVVIDFARYKIGERVILRNLSNPNNRDFSQTNVIMRFDVAGNATDTSDNSVPDVLNTNDPVMKLQPSEAVRSRDIIFGRKILGRGGGPWAINGTTWDDVVKSGFEFTIANPGLGDVETWEIFNPSGGWFHPVHPHLVEFKILDRNGKPPFPYERGPKDVVYAGESETARLLMRFGPHRGKYMIHCHNLTHEDHDMMAQFEVGSGGDDPFSAPPKPISEMKPL